jgi:branched-subunit amino acid transport protein
VTWLRNVPVAVLAAMLFPAIATQNGQLTIGPRNFFLLAAFPTLLVAWKTRSLFGSVLAGILVVALARLVLSL